jgi:hypothetical protein
MSIREGRKITYVRRRLKTQTVENLEENVIGEGVDGIVFKYPSFGIRRNYCVKVGVNMLDKEFDNIRSIQSCENYGSFPVSLEGVEFSEMTGDNKNLMVQFYNRRSHRPNSDMSTIKIYQLEIPYIKGELLFDFFDKFRADFYKVGNVNHWTGAGPTAHGSKKERAEERERNRLKPAIGINQFVSLYMSLIELYDAVKKMNDDGIFHNDIHEANIIIGENNLLYLIDFTRVSVGDEPTEEDEDGHWPDLPQVDILLEQCLWYGCENPLIYDYLRISGIVSDVNFNPNDELKAEIEIFIAENKHVVFDENQICLNINKFL